mmetsp:Transcript_64857/g.172340  ORF Transcript_64857/g.172340 Transcript_64857/m.172340 type:complete len:207 (+) Transcript_64857:196-816(+)
MEASCDSAVCFRNAASFLRPSTTGCSLFHWALNASSRRSNSFSRMIISLCVCWAAPRELLVLWSSCRVSCSSRDSTTTSPYSFSAALSDFSCFTFRSAISSVRESKRVFTTPSLIPASRLYSVCSACSCVLRSSQERRSAGVSEDTLRTCVSTRSVCSLATWTPRCRWSMRSAHLWTSAPRASTRRSVNRRFSTVAVKVVFVASSS